MIVVYKESCSKCVGLERQLSDLGYDWQAVRHMEGELSEELLDKIFRDYFGPRSELIREQEPAWIQSGLVIENVGLLELKEFILSKPEVLQRPIVIVNGEVVVARPPDRLWEILA